MSWGNTRILSLDTCHGLRPYSAQTGSRRSANIQYCLSVRKSGLEPIFSTV